MAKDLDDILVKTFVKEWLYKMTGCVFIFHPNEKSIDLIGANDSTYTNFGVEVERGSHIGDFWSNDYYPYLSKLGFMTVNTPIRKAKYWYDKQDNIYIPNNGKHLFIRTNYDFTQVIIVGPTSIKNKVIWTRFKAKNEDDVEDWLSFRREDTLTYNLIDGEWILDKIK